LLVLHYLDLSAAAARSDSSPAHWRRPFWHWLDGVERGWAIPVLLLLFVCIWTAYLAVAYIGSDLHPDVLETWTLGRGFEWGNPKHPPLMGWVTRAWTSIFPLTDWSLQLLAMVNAAIGLWAVDLITRRFAAGEKRVLILLLLMLPPTYQFHAQRFNANTILLSLWPIATYCFLRAFETRRAAWAAAAGATAALAMLGKYYSVFLVAGFAFAAMVHPQRRTYFASPSPWISAATGLFVLAPHLYWLSSTGAPPFNYALAHAGATFFGALYEASFFLTGLAAVMVIPALTWVLTAGRRLKDIPEDFKSLNNGLWLLFLIAIAAFTLPVAVSLSFGTDLPSLWAVQGLFLFVVVVVCGARHPVERFHCVNVAVFTGGIALAALLVGAPLHAIYRNAKGYEEGRSFYRLAALELTRQWRAHVDAPLTAVSGSDALAFGAAFYSPDHPLYARPFLYQYRWGLPRKTALERGWAALCFADQADCLDWMEKTAARAGDYLRFETELQASLLGRPGVTRSIVSLIVPPQSALPVEAPARAPEDVSANRRQRK
jgi:4-amino-4-deoxy-L-arabinose transferase-like glycosyltransferase